MTAETFVQRLALGTAQFGLAYGINNTLGRPTDEVVRDILTDAQAAGISLLDTAAAYGDSEARLGAWLHQQPQQPFQLITKVGAAAPAVVEAAVRASVARLQRPRVYGVLFHDFEALRRQPDAWQGLLAAQAAGLTERIGVSLYHPWQAEWLLERGYQPQLLQVPYNVLDQRFAPLLPQLATAGVEVHGRSAFLQGLLLRPLATLPGFFEALRPKLAHLQALLAQTGIPLEAGLLLFAATAPGLARVVIGVDSPENLRANLAAAAYLTDFGPVRAQLQTLAEPTDTYILPYAWPTPH
ncbi:aldo/keto reductase [Hymenobacter latericus]|uniref:aldo/keto reductase n=1 Tax=Hymenobacter sp. YIM 151858-1 TaxID=2987688 RepID=UPI002226EBB0|nr:aldo/keto reductase [Hymenobacter sp. YIM 151858-1]UYZ60581.1 aldo/keto reductase [Hymenobacter sp. YIM 151858-1]